MKWPEESLDGTQLNSVRDRSTIFVGSFPGQHDLQLWRCFGSDDEIYRTVCKLRKAHGTVTPFCEFDPYSYHYALMDNGHAVGAMTITRPDDGKVDCEAYYPPLLLDVFREDLLTSCRFIIRPTTKSSFSLLRWMTTNVWRDQVALGCRGAVINVQDHMVSFYRRMGFRILDGYGFTHPVLVTSSQVMTLRADPEEQPFFRDAFKNLDSIISARTWDRLLRLSTNPQINAGTPKSSGKIYSYSAGSKSLNPRGYRVVDRSDGSRIGEVCKLFPELTSYFCDSTMMLVAYPAHLGITSPGILIDSYLHAPTFIRSLHLAAIEQRPAVVVAQPLVGADFILQAICQGIPIPTRLLWHRRDRSFLVRRGQPARVGTTLLPESSQTRCI